MHCLSNGATSDDPDAEHSRPGIRTLIEVRVFSGQCRSPRESSTVSENVPPERPSGKCPSPGGSRHSALARKAMAK
jgi:hypothetical protein